MLKTVLAAAALAIAAPALADTHITFVNDSGQPSSQLYVKDGKVRMEFSDGTHHGFALYDAAANSMTLFMPERKEYLVYNEQSAGQIGAQANAAQQQMQAEMAQHQGEMDQANAQMQAAMAKMTPEQRAMMQKMMPQQGAGPMAAMHGGGAQMEMKELGTTETIAGHVCRDMQMVMNGRPMSTFCVMDSPASLGIPSADLKTLEVMRDGMHKLAEKMGPMAQNMSSMMSKGFAIKTTHQTFQNMKMVTVTDTLKSVDTGRLSATLFSSPAGYTETTMQQMMQEHGRR